MDCRLTLLPSLISLLQLCYTTTLSCTECVEPRVADELYPSFSSALLYLAYQVPHTTQLRLLSSTTAV